MITNQTERLNFASTKNIPAYPDFLDVQVKSFKIFQLETKSDERGNEGLYNTFMENFPITDTNNFVLNFDYFVDPRYTIQECIERGLTHSAFKSKVKLYCTDPEHEDFETIVQDVYLGTLHDTKWYLLINGAERVVVSQLHRSPGFSLDSLSC
jgi:DNA-directed RNA polymerase subunit beta